MTSPVRVGINGFGRIGRCLFKHLLQRGDYGRGHQRPRGPRRPRLPPQVRLRPRLVGPPGLRHGPRARRRRDEDPVLLLEGPRRAPVGRLGSGRRRRVLGRLPQARGRRQAPRGRREEGRDLGARRRPGRHVRPRRERPHVRPRQAPRRLDGVLHDELPRARREGPPRVVRRRAPHDHDGPRVHVEPVAHGRPDAQAPEGPRRRALDRPDVDRSREGNGPRDPRAQGKDGRDGAPRPGSGRLDHGHRRDAPEGRHAGLDQRGARERRGDPGAQGHPAGRGRGARLARHPRRHALGDRRPRLHDGPRKRVAKVLVWYDNEWGYSARLADFAALLSARL